MDRAASDPDATVVRPRAAREVDPDATVLRPVAPASRRDDPDATVIVALGPLPGAPPRGQPALPRAPTLALSPGLRLHEYRIDRVLGQGGFGITYLATDVHLNAAVAIKEYLPEEIAFRAGDRSVSPNASRHRDRYRAGLESFLVEARTLASFRHPAIVRVARFFEAHRTAYMVMEYEQGSPFKTWWPQHAALGEAALVSSLALPEALQRGDSQLEAEARAPHERVQARLRRGLRTLHTPRDWPLALKLSLAMVATACCRWR